jgi:hypothetical protein
MLHVNMAGCKGLYLLGGHDVLSLVCLAKNLAAMLPYSHTKLESTVQTEALAKKSVFNEALQGRPQPRW